MTLRIAAFEAGARAATGAVVIIDVFRAFTTAAVALSRGAERIVMVGTAEEAFALRASGQAARAMGERGGIAIEGFDHGNSPAEIASERFDGETLVQTTSNGTRGIVAAGGAERVYAGALVTAEATVTALAGAPEITLVAMGEGTDAAPVPTIEDALCVHWLAARLAGRRPEPAALTAAILSLSPRTDGVALSDADVDACLALDSVPFAIRVSREDGLLVARAEPPA
ncbi:MAG: 2-phosphosulfolactate phosphatase [Pseudomonadota bacterium]